MFPFNSNAALSKQITALQTIVSAIQVQNGQILTALKTLIAQGAQIMATANSLDTSIAALQADITAETTVNQSAITLLNGIPGLIAQAVQQAQAAGATPAELASLTALQTSLAANTAGLATAVTANTPAA